MLQDARDAGLKERQVHETDATKVRFLLVFGDDLAESSDHVLGGWTQGHDAFVFCGDGKVIQSKTRKVAAVTRFLSQALRQRCEDVILSTANHWNTVLLVANIAELVDALCSSSTLLAFRVEHGFDQFGNVIECGWFRGGTLCRRSLIIGGSLIEYEWSNAANCELVSTTNHKQNLLSHWPEQRSRVLQLPSWIRPSFCV